MCFCLGVRGDAICPCACSSESLTVCVRRAGRGGSSAGRGVLSMSGLSYGVVRVDAENSLTSLTLQDCGQVMPSCKSKLQHVQKSFKSSRQSSINVQINHAIIMKKKQIKMVLFLS